MSKKHEIAGTVADATLPKTPVQIGGKTFNLCCDLGALSQAETRINEELLRAKSDKRVNLLFAMAEENLYNTQILFAAAMRPFHPEIAFGDAVGMVTAGNVFDVLFALRAAWKASAPQERLGQKPNPAEAQPGK